MSVALKLTTIGNSTGLVLPKEILARLRVQRGDTVFLTESPEGYVLTPYDEEFAKQVAIAEDVMDRYKNTLHELAK